MISLWILVVGLAANNASEDNDCFTYVDRWLLQSVIFFPGSICTAILFNRLYGLQHDQIMAPIVTALFGFAPAIPTLLFHREACTRPPPFSTTCVRWVLCGALTYMTAGAVVSLLQHLFEARRERLAREESMELFREALAEPDPQEAVRLYNSVSEYYRGAPRQMVSHACAIIYIKKHAQLLRALGLRCTACDGSVVDGLHVLGCCLLPYHLDCLYKLCIAEGARCALCHSEHFLHINT